MAKRYDLAVLGSGPGGYTAAIRASQLGFKTAIIERDNLGGICLNWGCIPTKSLLKNAELFDMMKNHSGAFGIKTEGLSYDFEKIIKRSRNVSAKVSKGVEYLMKKNKIDHIKGFGKFVSAKEINIFDGGGKLVDTIKANHVIIATGASPKQIPSIEVDHKNIITSTEAMSLEKQPGELIIIGAGAIGVEFAYFYNALGTKVTLIEMLDSILPIEDSECSKVVESNFKKRGIEIFTGAKVIEAKVSGKSVKVVIEKGGVKTELNAEKVLNAIGVSGNIDGFGLKEIGVETEKGHIKVDKSNYRTNIQDVYAIGDVIGAPWLAHVASAEGVHCVEKIKGIQKPDIDYTAVPGCTYCQPQVASVGLSEKAAKEKGYAVKVGKFSFKPSGKAIAIGDNDGFVKLVFDAKYGQLLGAHIVHGEATELISELVLGLDVEVTMQTLIRAVHPHPTLSEAIMEAAAVAAGECVHL